MKQRSVTVLQFRHSIPYSTSSFHFYCPIEQPTKFNDTNFALVALTLFVKAPEGKNSSS